MQTISSSFKGSWKLYENIDSGRRSDCNQSELKDACTNNLVIKNGFIGLLITQYLLWLNWIDWVQSVCSNGKILSKGCFPNDSVK